MPPRKKRSKRNTAALPPTQSDEQNVVAELSLEKHDIPQNAPSDDYNSEGHVSEENEGQTEKPQKKAKRSVHLTMDQETTIIEWLKNHEVLYNKKLEAYKDTKRKALLWQKLSEEMGKPVDELKTWYSSLRTRYTKLRKLKSGDGDPEHSERDQWVLQNFSFLAAFTYEVKRRPLVSLKAKIPPPSTSAAPEPICDDEASSISGQITCQSTDNRQQLTSSGTTESLTSSGSTTSKASNAISSVVAGKMDQFMELQTSLMQQIVRPNKDRMKEAFIDYVKESVYEIDPSLWNEMHRDIMKTVLTYKDRDSELKRGQHRTTTVECSAGWQPPPQMWPSTVQNPMSVCGSTDPTWVKQQFSQQQCFSQRLQSSNDCQPSQQPYMIQELRPPSRQQSSSRLSTPQCVFNSVASTTDIYNSPATSIHSGLSALLDTPNVTQNDEPEDPL